MILVTGGTGLTGSHLLFELTKKGYSVKATKRANSSVEFVRKVFSLYTHNPDTQLSLIEWVDIDLSDYKSIFAATVGIDTVFHTAAVVSFNPKDAVSIKETNVNGTANLVDACLANGVKTLCHISSIASLGEPNAEGIVDEQCSWTKSKGQSAYAKSKFYGEMEVWRGAEHGLRVMIVNPSVILGPGRWRSGSGQIFSRIKKGLPIYTSGITGYVDVRDVARAMILLYERSEIKNERFILNSQNISFKELFSMIAEGFGKKQPSIEIKPWVISIIYPFAKIIGTLAGKGTAVSKANLNSAFGKTYCSASKIEKAIGYKFIPIEESIKSICNIYQTGF